MVDAYHTAIGWLRKLDRVLEASSGFALWVAGITLMAAGVFEITALFELASQPRVFLFTVGFFAWAAGGMTRAAQKKAARLERDLERCKDMRDFYQDELQRERDSGEN